MKILAIESSCDETAAAVIEDGRKICSNVIDSRWRPMRFMEVSFPKSHHADIWRQWCV